MTDEIQIQSDRQRRERIILAAPTKFVGGFFSFVRERGVAGFAIGFILGGATQTLVQALMNDIVNPFLALLFGGASRLEEYTIGVFKIGDFLSALVNFLILCLVVYIVFKMLQLEKLDKQKE